MFTPFKQDLIVGSLSAMLISMVACTHAAHHPVSWWQSHKDELASKVAWCADDKARQADIDCQNAMQAFGLNGAGDWKTRRQAPTQFGPPPSSGVPPQRQ